MSGATAAGAQHRTICKNGHPFGKADTYREPNGRRRRRCRICSNEMARKYRQTEGYRLARDLRRAPVPVDPEPLWAAFCAPGEVERRIEALRTEECPTVRCFECGSSSLSRKQSVSLHQIIAGLVS